MKKTLLLTLLFLAFSLVTAPVSQAYYADNSYYQYPPANTQFHPKHPDYYDGNLRYTLKARADIERASSPNVHYDKYQGDYYTCNWNYNTNLGTWVCDKSYPSRIAQPIQVCPVGYHLNNVGTACERNQIKYVSYPTTVIQPAITYYVYEDSAFPKYDLVATGMGAGWVLLLSSGIGFYVARRK